MTLDDIHRDTATPAAPEASDTPALAPSALLLVVAPARRPGGVDAAGLRWVRWRCVALAGIDEIADAAAAARFDALLLDARALEGRDGSTLSTLRALLGCPVMVLSEGGDEVDEIVAFELGADDWLATPVTPRRLRAHVAALLRRPGPSGGEAARPRPASPTGWRVDRTTNVLRRAGRSIALTETQAALLQCLIDASGRVVPRGQLIATLPQSRVKHERDIDVYLHRLRKRLRDAGAPDLAIEGIRNRGYLLQVAA